MMLNQKSQDQKDNLEYLDVQSCCQTFNPDYLIQLHPFDLYLILKGISKVAQQLYIRI